MALTRIPPTELAAPVRGRILFLSGLFGMIRARLVRRVVYLGRMAKADRKTETPDRGVRAYRPQAVHGVRRDMHQIPLDNLPFFTRDRHDAPAADDVVQLVGVVLVRVYVSAAFHLELTDELEIPAQRRGFHLSRPVQPPHGDRPLVLRRHGHTFDRPNVHNRPPPIPAPSSQPCRARHCRVHYTRDNGCTGRIDRLLHVHPLGNRDELAHVPLGHEFEWYQDVLRELHPREVQVAAPDPSAALAFGVLENGRVQIPLLNRVQGLRQPVDTGHVHLAEELELTRNLERAQNHVVVVGHDEVVTLVAREQTLRHALPLAAVIVRVLLGEADLVEQVLRLETVLEAIVPRNVRDLSRHPAQVDPFELRLAELFVQAGQPDPELCAGVRLLRPDERHPLTPFGLPVELHHGHALLVGGHDRCRGCLQAGRLEGETVHSLSKHALYVLQLFFGVVKRVGLQTFDTQGFAGCLRGLLESGHVGKCEILIRDSKGPRLRRRNGSARSDGEQHECNRERQCLVPHPLPPYGESSTYTTSGAPRTSSLRHGWICTGTRCQYPLCRNTAPSHTAAMMITPMTICWIGAGTLSITSPLNNTPMISAPTMVFVILPRPPNSDAPPTTAAAMACSSNP